MDPSNPRPKIRCLVAFPMKDGHVWPLKPNVVTLVEAVAYKKLGYAVLVDPEDEAELARWEQLHRDK